MPAKIQTNDDRVKNILSQRIEQGIALGEAKYPDLISESCVAYQTSHKASMPEMRKAILATTIDQFATRLRQQGVPTSYIKEAAENVGNVDNPIAMMFSMISLLVPNFAYMDACAVQPMPTQKAPIFFQQLTANTDRNGVTAGDKLLGGTTWNDNNQFSSNRHKKAISGASAYTLTADYKPLIPGKIRLSNADGSVVLTDKAVPGTLAVVKGTATVSAQSIDVDAGTVDFSLTVTLNGGVFDYRYDLDAGGYDPAQVLYEWATKEISAEPRRLRSLYSLENYYAAKQVLKGVDIDSLLETSIGGYINKEISCGVFDDMFDERSATPVEWNKKLPSGVSWAFHRLSLLETFVTASNALRKNIARGGGNIIVAVSTWMNYIETLGNDLWAPNKYPREPIGPYVAGTLNNKFTVIKNQQYDDDEAILTYKADDTDASYVVGVFIALYNTDPIALDDLKVRRGLGTSIGQELIFEDSIIQCTVVDESYS